MNFLEIFLEYLKNKNVFVNKNFKQVHLKKKK